MVTVVVLLGSVLFMMGLPNSWVMMILVTTYVFTVGGAFYLYKKKSE